MSDIYLQITETPTVVTLSAPVVSGALASTVTVANTVTVALDSNSLSALENVTVTVGAAITGTVTVANFPSTQTIAGTVTANPTGTQTIAGTVTVGVLPDLTTSTDFEQAGTQIAAGLNNYGSIPVAINNALPAGTAQIGSVTANLGTSSRNEVYEGIFNFSENNQMGIYVTDPLPAGTNRIGVVTIGGGTVTIGAGTSQIGSVTASISGTVPVSGTFWQATQPVSGTFFQATQPVSLASTTVTVSSLPALAAGTAQIGSVTASISNTVVTFYPLQGTTVSNTNFTSVTASTTLVSAVAGREVLTVFNEGAGNLHISAGGICTTTAYQVRLSAGDYWECPAGQLSLAHTAVFATAGTARVTQVS
jgi:hypothetical protein